MSRVIWYAFGSLVVSIVVFGAKWTAYSLTGSTLLFADAAETTVNVVAAALALFALRVSSKPPDRNHPYGHNKVEYISAAVEGAMMATTALVNGREAIEGFLHPVLPEHSGLGLTLSGCAGCLNLVWGLVLLRAGRQLTSPALQASGRHVLSDVWWTLAVLGGFALTVFTGWLWLEAVLTLAIALNILRAAYQTLRGAVGALMDELPDPRLVPVIGQVIGKHAQGAIEAHDLRARVVGATTFVEFHLVVPGDMTVEAAHGICDHIEEALRGEVGRAVIHIHTEPEGKAKGRQAVWRAANPAVIPRLP